jgi:hypothetical protein
MRGAGLLAAGHLLTPLTGNTIHLGHDVIVSTT